MNTVVTIRDAGRGDAAALAGFNVAMALETEDKRLHPQTVERGVTALLEAPEKGFYLVADVDGRAAGCLMVTFEWSDWRDGDFWWIQSVFVQPGQRGKGVFRALYREVRRRADTHGGVCGLRLYVEERNNNARQTYRRLGMRRTGYLVMEQELAR